MSASARRRNIWRESRKREQNSALCKGGGGRRRFRFGDFLTWVGFGRLREKNSFKFTINCGGSHNRVNSFWWSENQNGAKNSSFNLKVDLHCMNLSGKYSSNV